VHDANDEDIVSNSENDEHDEEGVYHYDPIQRYFPNK